MDKLNFDLSTPILNAAGSLGFSPEARGPIDLGGLGAFITNPISLRPRKAARGTRLQSYPGGALMHSGHPNPGLKSVLKKHRSRWLRAGLPVIVHLLGGAPQEMGKMMMLLEEEDSVMGVEIGLPQEIDQATTQEIVEAAIGELPLMVRVPLSKAVEIGRAAYDAGASAISLGPPRGALTDAQGETVFGRLYGPGVFPQDLEAVCSLVKANIPVVGGGGIYQPEQIELILNAGAMAVQLDTVLWRGEWKNRQIGNQDI